MKKLLLTLCFISLFITGCVASNPIEDENGIINKNDEIKNKTDTRKINYVSYNGKL